MNIRIEETNVNDYREVENLTREAFWDVFKAGCDEHLVVHQLHETGSFVKELDLVAKVDEKIVGNCMCSIAKIIQDNDVHDLLILGPISVLPEYQCKGVGSALIRETITKAKELGYIGIVLYGDPCYYHKFGFINARTYRIKTAMGMSMEEFMAKELVTGSLKGIKGNCYEALAYHIDPVALAEFEKNFPAKESHYKK